MMDILLVVLVDGIHTLRELRQCNRRTPNEARVLHYSVHNGNKCVAFHFKYPFKVTAFKIKVTSKESKYVS